MFKSFLLSVSVLLCLSHAAAAQSASSPFPPSPRDRDRSPLGSPEEELRQRAAIRHGEASYKENLERAREGAQLGAELRATFERNRSLSREDLKKLERMEKLARKIRGAAGGSDDDELLDDPPQRLEAAFVRLAELSEQLRKQVEKTSRLVVSASVIERSNEMIELIRLIRTLPH
jgi:hypothetical protein